MSELKVNVWDWVVTKEGKIMQIDSDDMQDLKHEDILRLATKEEMIKGIKSKVRSTIDEISGVSGAREILDKYSPLPTDPPTYSQYTVLKAMEEYSNIKSKQLT